MSYKNAGTTLNRFVTNHTFDRQTDGWIDRILIARPHMHFMQCGKNKMLEQLSKQY